MPIEPIENQTAYAKSNIIKGKIPFLTLPYFPLFLPRANSEERVKPAGKCTTRSTNPMSPMCSLPTKSEQRQTEATQEGPTDAKSPEGELDEFCGRAGVSIPIKFSQHPQLLGSGEKCKLFDHARCAACRRTPCRPLLCRGRRSRQTLLLPSSGHIEPKWRTWRIVGLRGLVANPPTVSALPAR